MVSKRDRILKIIEYLESLGVEVNVSRNKARGNKGFFKKNYQGYRIDIAKGLSEDETFSVLIHEFAHFMHYKHDNTLKTLSFILVNEEEYLDELLELTVECVPKKDIAPLFEEKELLKNEIKRINEDLKREYPDFKLNSQYKPLESKIKRTPYKYLLKHDRVKVLNGFFFEFYSVDEIKEDCDINRYLILKSKQRQLKRITNKMSKINRYYNSMTELFARSFEIFINNPDKCMQLAPNLTKQYQSVVESKKIKMLNDLLTLLNL